MAVMSLVLTVCRQLHLAEVSELRTQLESVSAQLSDHKEQHASCCLLVQSQADLRYRAAAERHMQHTAQQAHLHEQTVQSFKQQCEQQVAKITSLELRLQAATAELGKLRATHSECNASAGQHALHDVQTGQSPVHTQTVGHLQEQQSAQISSLQLELQATTAELEMLRASCCQSAGPGTHPTTEGVDELHSSRAAAVNSRLLTQHQIWMRRVPELLHWKRAGFLLVRTALRKWAAVASAERSHRRHFRRVVW